VTLDTAREEIDGWEEELRYGKKKREEDRMLFFYSVNQIKYNIIIYNIQNRKAEKV